MLDKKSGYIKTTIGFIPKEWELKKIENLGFTFSGLSGKNKDDFGSGLPYIPYKNIYQNGKIDTSFLDYVQIKPNENQHKVQYGDLFFTTSSETADEVGLTSVLLDEVDEMYLNSFCFGFRLNDFEVLTPQYSVYLFRGEKIRQKISELAQGSTRFNLSKSGLLKLQIPIPPLPEQQKIASILSTWDEAIAKQKSLVEQTKKRNQGLAQQLLTGKKRLKGFDGEWNNLKFGEVINRITRRNDIENTNVVTISAKRGFVRQDDFFNKQVASETLTNYYLLKKGEFAYNKSYSGGYPMGAFKRLNNFDFGVVTTLYICFSIKDDFDSDFFLHYFEAGQMTHGLTKIAQEGGRAHGLLNIGLSDFLNLKIRIPNLNEQKEISNIIENADLELKLQEKHLTSLQNEKKGLMQKLLTGEIRVKLT